MIKLTMERVSLKMTIQENDIGNNDERNLHFFIYIIATINREMHFY